MKDLKNQNIEKHGDPGPFLVEAKKLWIMKDARHNDWPMFVDRPFLKEIMDFIRSHDKG